MHRSKPEGEQGVNRLGIRGDFSVSQQELTVYTEFEHGHARNFKTFGCGKAPLAGQFHPYTRKAKFELSDLEQLLKVRESTAWTLPPATVFSVSPCCGQMRTQRVTAVDWKNVLEVALENAEKFGVADRYTTLPGSIFDVDIGSGYDLVLIPNFLHHFDVATNENLLRNLHAGIVPGGRVVTLEFVPNDDRVSPPMPATFALIMLAETPSGDAYTRAELESMMRNAGFTDHEFHPMPPSPHSVLISRRV
jgi:hypothetical protein